MMSIWINVITVVTLLFTVKHVSARDDDLYDIPLPEIVTFSTGGLRISIPDKNGIAGFRFHGNVNQEIDPLRQGTINLETHQTSKGKWVLESRRPLLKRGDTISYWLFVKKDRLGYVKQPLAYKVKELVPYYGMLPLPLHPDAPPPFNFPLPSISTTTEVNYPTTENEFSNNDCFMCYNNNESSTALEVQIEALTKKVEILIKVIEKLPDAKKLTISGRIFEDENPAATVRFVLWDKFDIKPKIVSAVRNNDNSITFEMETIEEKIRVLMLAQEMLKMNSKIMIS